jgi:hypothetical protein
MIEGATKMPDPITLPTMSVVASRRERPRTSVAVSGRVVRTDSAMLPPPSVGFLRVAEHSTAPNGASGKLL